MLRAAQRHQSFWQCGKKLLKNQGIVKPAVVPILVAANVAFTPLKVAASSQSTTKRSQNGRFDVAPKPHAWQKPVEILVAPQNHPRMPPVS
jgi:hypothetical protein